jgi:DNA polymerase III delta subunit
MVSVLTGSNSFALQQTLNAHVFAFKAEHGDLAFEQVDASETALQKIIETVRALPFLSTKRMVVLRGISENKEVADAIAQVCTAVDEATDLFIVEPKFDKRSIAYKYLTKHAAVKEFTELDDMSLAEWLQNEASQHNATLSRQDARLLVGRVGHDQLRLFHELQKLIDYNPNITAKTIELLTDQSAQSSTFDLLDTALRKDTVTALRLYDEQRLQRVEPQAIIGLLAWQLHILALLTTAGTRSAADIASEAKVNPFVVRKSMPIAKQLGKAGVVRLIAALKNIDVASKTSSLDVDEALRQFIVAI